MNMPADAMEVIEVPLQAGQSLGLKLTGQNRPRKDVRVEAVEQGSVAEAYGIQKGDFITAVGEARREDGKLLDVAGVKYSIRSNERPVTVTFERPESGEAKKRGPKLSFSFGHGKGIKARNAERPFSEASAGTHNRTAKTNLKAEAESAMGLLDAALAKEGQGEAKEAMEGVREKLVTILESADERERRREEAEDRALRLERQLDEGTTSTVTREGKNGEEQEHESTATTDEEGVQALNEEVARKEEALEQKAKEVASLEKRLAEVNDAMERLSRERQEKDEEVAALREEVQEMAEGRAKKESDKNGGLKPEEVEALREEVRVKEEQLQEAKAESERLAKKAAEAEKQVVTEKGTKRATKKLAEERDQLASELEGVRHQVRITHANAPFKPLRIEGRYGCWWHLSSA